MEKYTHFKKMVNEALQVLKFPEEPKRLYQPITYILSPDGKRLRPVLVLAACDLFGGHVESALAVATGIEIFHNFTLLHDDIMDKADMRRGKATVHKKWNPDIAILSGDTMFALAYQQILSSNNATNKAEILETFTKTAIEVCEGQQYDMDFETSQTVTISEYLNMIRLKTAVLLACSLKTGALCANAPDVQAQLLYDFGINIGMAFQLKDDYLDAFCDSEKFGKKTGGDIASNKKTYLYLKCIELANENDRKKLFDYYHQDISLNEEKIKEVLRLFNKYEIKNHIVEEMENYFNQSIDLIQDLQADTIKKTTLLTYAQWLYQRNY